MAKRQVIGTPPDYISLGDAFELCFQYYEKFSKLEVTYYTDSEGWTSISDEYTIKRHNLENDLQNSMRQAFYDGELIAYYIVEAITPHSGYAFTPYALSRGINWLNKGLNADLGDYNDNLQPPEVFINGEYKKIFLYKTAFEEWQKRHVKDLRYHCVQYSKLEINEEIEISNSLELEPLINNPAAKDFNPMEELHWNIAMLLAWLIWQDIEQVTLYCDKYRKKHEFWGASIKMNMPDGTGHFKTEHFRDVKRKSDIPVLGELFLDYTEAFNKKPILKTYENAKSLLNEMRAAGNLIVYKKDYEQLEVYEKDDIFIDSPRLNLVVKLKDIIPLFDINIKQMPALTGGRDLQGAINAPANQMDILKENSYWIYRGLAPHTPIMTKEHIFLYDAFHDYYMSQKSDKLDDFLVASQFRFHLFKYVFASCKEFKESGLTRQEYIADLYEKNEIYADILFRVFMLFILNGYNKYRYIDKKRTGELLDLANKNQITGSHIAEVILKNDNVNEYLMNMDGFFHTQLNNFFTMLRIHDVSTGLRPLIGGAIERIETGFWITEQTKPLYMFCAFNQSAPYCENPFKADGEVKWIYLERESLNQAIEQFHGGGAVAEPAAPEPAGDGKGKQAIIKPLGRGKKPVMRPNIWAKMELYIDGGRVHYNAANEVIRQTRIRIKELEKLNTHSEEAATLKHELGVGDDKNLARNLVESYRKYYKSDTYGR